MPLTQTLPLYHPDFLGNLQKHAIKNIGGENFGTLNGEDMATFAYTK